VYSWWRIDAPDAQRAVASDRDFRYAADARQATRQSEGSRSALARGRLLSGGLLFDCQTPAATDCRRGVEPAVTFRVKLDDVRDGHAVGVSPGQRPALETSRAWPHSEPFLVPVRQLLACSPGATRRGRSIGAVDGLGSGSCESGAVFRGACHVGASRKVADRYGLRREMRRV